MFDVPLELLREIVRCRAALDRLERSAARAARGAGATWPMIGEALGVTPQAAHRRHADRAAIEARRAAHAATPRAQELARIKELHAPFTSSRVDTSEVSTRVEEQREPGTGTERTV